jgi:hypothetical protein
MGRLIYTGQALKESGNPKSNFSVFLAGPTPRSASVKSWRPDMISILRSRGFTGDIIIPEYKDEYESDKPKSFVYDKRISWEVHWLKKSTAILFWIPRKMSTMPALTTNIEFGEFMKSEKVILGYPPDAEHVSYMATRAKWLDIPIANTMSEAADYIINKEKIFLYACPRCLGSGKKDSNGRMHRCSKCDGTGFLEPTKKVRKFK